MSDRVFSWKEFDEALDKIEKQIKTSAIKFNWIISINRGGLIAGVALSHRLGVNHGVITIKNYDGKNKKKNIVRDLYISLDPKSEFSGNLLIVDEIATSGETLQEAKKFIKKDHDIRLIKTATLHYQDKSIIKPDFYTEQVSSEVWIKYPWEKYD